MLVFLFAGCRFKSKEADIIYHNAVIYTVDGDFSMKEAIAIKDGFIVAIGTEREILNEYRANRTIDCQKRFIYPGFIDAHCHFLGYGQTLSEIDLSGKGSFAEVLRTLTEFHQKNPDKEWIIGRGWDQNDWENSVGTDDLVEFPTNSELNKIFPNTLVALTRVDGHAMLVNQRVLEMAKISENTKIDGGLIEQKDGILTGILLDNAMSLVQAITPLPTEDENREALLAAQENCFAVGLTTIDDAGLSLGDVQLIKKMQAEQQLKMRMYVMLSDVEENYDYYFKHGIDTSAYLTVRAFKFFADGALGSRGACLLKPYSDVTDRSEYGFLLKNKGYLSLRAEQLYDRGFQMCTHAIGDSAVRTVLDVYGGVLEGTNDRRWRIEHAQVVSQEDVLKFGLYSVIPSVQPTHATSDLPWSLQRLGKERMESAYSYQELKKQLGMIALGTDFPVEDISPLKTFYASVVGEVGNKYQDSIFLGRNRLSREDALRGMTIWPAMANFEEDKKGTLEVGKFADFTMLNLDIMKAPEKVLPEVYVLMTVVGGEIVYSK